MKGFKDVVAKRWVVRDMCSPDSYENEEDAKWCYFGGFVKDQWDRVKFKEAVKFKTEEEAKQVLREVFRRFFDVNQDTFKSEKSAALHFTWAVCCTEIVVSSCVDTQEVLGFKRRKENG